jgi:hypothetical protein
MNTTTHTIKIIHEQLGVLLNESFIDATQFKLFLKMVNGCLTLKESLTFFNGQDFLINIPTKILSECVVVTNVEPYTLAEHLRHKSKIEQPA